MYVTAIYRFLIHELFFTTAAELQQYFVVENVASSENSRIKTVHIKATGNQLEANREYTLRIKATDTAAPVGTQEANAEVRVKVGQLPPQFMEQRYDVQVQEDNRVGQVYVFCISIPFKSSMQT